MYKVEDGQIIITDKADFNIRHILECGQIFRYTQQSSGEYEVYSGNKFALVCESGAGYTISTKDVEYFIRFFDLSTDYTQIKARLTDYGNAFLSDAIRFGAGIRILRNDPLEMIISFIISANNNIPRIKQSISKICATLGADLGGGHYAFPTLNALLQADEAFFKGVGLGYRASYIVETVKALQGRDLSALGQLSTADIRHELMQLKGVGRKVADCIMLFGFGKMDVFPIDTWTNKVYAEHFYAGEKSRPQIADFFTQTFGDLSGYAQQYFYYWKQNANASTTANATPPASTA